MESDSIDENGVKEFDVKVLNVEGMFLNMVRRDQFMINERFLSN